MLCELHPNFANSIVLQYMSSDLNEVRFWKIVKDIEHSVGQDRNYQQV